MVAESGAGHLSGTPDSVRDRLLRRSEMVASRAVLDACHGCARRRPHKCLQRANAKGGATTSADKARAVASRHSVRISSVVARLHRPERARLFALLHFRQACVDSFDCWRMRGLLFQRQARLAYWNRGDVVRPACSALPLLQPWKRVVDRSHRDESPLLRVGFRVKRDCCRSVAKSGTSLAFASGMLHDHRGRHRVLRVSPLL